MLLQSWIHVSHGKSTLQALEEETWKDLPGGIFKRSMVRSYCNFLGLNETEWLGRLEACSPAAMQEDWIEFAENVKRARMAPDHGFRRRWCGVAVMFAMLSGLSWAAWR